MGVLVVKLGDVFIFEISLVIWMVWVRVVNKDDLSFIYLRIIDLVCMI